MDEQTTAGSAEPRAADETLSRTELQIEHEKLKLERERILLERERLEAMRDRVRIESGMHLGKDGRPSVPFSTMALMGIICLLVGGILGAVSSSAQRDRRSAARLQEVMNTLAAGAPESGGFSTNENASAGAEMPPWLKTMKPKGAYSGISLVVVQ